MVLFPYWLPTERLTQPEVDLVTDGIRDAALETDALALESELRTAFLLLGVSEVTVVEIFDQARSESRLRAPHASAFEVRHQAAIDTRAILKRLIRTRENY